MGVIANRKGRKSQYPDGHNPDELEELREQQNATNDELKQLVLKNQEKDTLSKQAIEKLQLEVTEFCYECDDIIQAMACSSIIAPSEV